MKQILAASLLLLAGCEYQGLDTSPLKNEEIKARADKCYELRLKAVPLQRMDDRVYDVVCVPEPYGDRT